MAAATNLFPNETTEYRAARDRLLEAEIGLRNNIERVARMRRELPPGPVVRNDYVFHEGPRGPSAGGPPAPIRLSELFGDKHDELILINYMYGPDDDSPCPMCTMWADSYDAVAPYIEQRATFALVAAAGIEKVGRLARDRGWRNLRLLSSYGTTFNADYHVEDRDGAQHPGVMVFQREPDGTIRLFHACEMMLAEKFTPPTGADPRGIDLYSPVWQLFDLLPGGRGTWYPSLANQPDWYAEAVQASQT